MVAVRKRTFGFRKWVGWEGEEGVCIIPGVYWATALLYARPPSNLTGRPNAIHRLFLAMQAKTHRRRLRQTDVIAHRALDTIEGHDQKQARP